MNNTLKAAIAIAVLGIATFIISGISRFKNAHHGADHIVGQTVWLIFLACLLALVVLGAMGLVRIARRRRSHA